jgi:hypothetical protein
MLFTQVIHDKYSDKKDVQSSFEYDLLFDQIKLTEKINEWYFLKDKNKTNFN